MRYQFVVATGLLAVSLGAAAAAGAAAQTLPVRNGRPIVAAVGAESISLDELVAELGPAADRARLQQGRATAADLGVLDRLVTIKLIVQDATSMGLGEAPEIQKQVEVTSREILREVLYARLTRDVKPDPAAVDRVFKDLVREWKTTSLLFQDKAAAERARKEIGGGAAFTDVAARAVAAKAARTDGDDQYHPKTAYLPQILQAMAPLKVGQVSPVIQIPAGLVLLRVADMRYPQNAEALAEARKQVLSQQQEVALRAHEQVLRRQYVTFHKAGTRRPQLRGPEARPRGSAEGQARHRRHPGRRAGHRRRPDRLPADAVLPWVGAGPAVQAHERDEGASVRRHGRAEAGQRGGAEARD